MSKKDRFLILQLTINEKKEENIKCIQHLHFVGDVNERYKMVPLHL